MMKRKVLYIVMGALLVFGLSLGQAFAQQAPAQDPMKSQDQLTTEQKAGAAGQKTEQKLTGSHRGSEFMNKNLKSQQGENLGKVKDIVFDRQGELSYIVVSKADAPDKLIPIPFSQDMVQFEQDAIVISGMDKSRLQEAPTFSSAEWKKLEDPQFESQVHGYYGAQAPGQRSPGMTSPGSGAGQIPGTQERRSN